MPPQLLLPLGAPVVTGPDWINIEDDVTCIKTKRPDKRLSA